MVRNFRKTQLAALGAAGILFAGSVPQAGAADLTGAVSQSQNVQAETSKIRTIPLSAAAVPLSTSADPYQIVAIGDSLTVGYEHGMTDPAALYGYVGRVYEQALYHGAATVSNYGVLGLKSEGLKNWLNAVAQGKTIAPEEAQSGISKYTQTLFQFDKSAEMKEAIAKADTIVMTIGGNDYLPLFADLQARDVTLDELKKLLADTLTNYMERLEASLQVLRELNPNAKIVLADQYLPFPKPNQLIQVVTQEQYDVLTEAVTNLHDSLVKLAGIFASKDMSLSIVDISTPFTGQQFVLTSIRDKDVHPNNDGYEIFGERFAKAIWGEYRKPEALSPGVPLHLIVNGKELAGGNKPVVKNGTTFLPMRDVAGALGATLGWDSKTSTVTLKAGDKEVAFTIGAKTMNINGQSVPLETPAYLVKTGAATSSTYLPLAALSKGLGYQVVYRKTIQTAFINS